jgi:putative acetyltransferase
MAGVLNLTFRHDDLSGDAIRGLLREHLEHMIAITPRHSAHALSVDALGASDVTFWSAWDGEVLAGCGALRQLDASSGEVKSMRTASGYLRRGVAAAVLSHIIGVARGRGYEAICLETGAFPDFEPARALYRRFGFETCGPFGSYREDPNTVFMRLRLD